MSRRESLELLRRARPPDYLAVDDFDRIGTRPAISSNTMLSRSNCAPQTVAWWASTKAVPTFGCRRTAFGAGRKCDTGGMRGIGGEDQNERGFGKVEFIGDSLHPRFGEAAGVQDNGDGIAAELLIGENVDSLEFNLRQISLPHCFAEIRMETLKFEILELVIQAASWRRSKDHKISLAPSQRDPGRGCIHASDSGVTHDLNKGRLVAEGVGTHDLPLHDLIAERRRSSRSAHR